MEKSIVVTKLEPPKIPEDWDYKASVKRVKNLTYKWINLTEELATELWIAREMLSAQGQRTDLTSGQKSRSWTNYCQDIGSSRRVVNRWLRRWFTPTVEKPEETPKLPAGKFNIVYADPPWQYRNAGFDESAEQQYPTMSSEELYNLIEKLNPCLANPSALFLWVTNPFLWVGFQLIEHWSFDYKTDMVWIKNKGPSIGWFTQSRHEHLLIATRGEGMHPKHRPISWFEAPVTRHSKKPELMYELIEKMYPDGKYLELFARNKRKNWTSWGLEV